MKLYGSLHNRIMEGPTAIVPTVGMGATISMFSDRHAATIVDVKGKRVAVQEDVSKRVDKNGMSESQEYQFTADPTSPVRWFSLRKSGRYVEVGGSTGLIINYRSTYHDFSF